MNVEKNQLNTSEKTLCKTCKRFYGSQAFAGMCSSCYKKTLTKEQTIQSKTQEIISPALTAADITQKMQQLSIENKQIDKKRCYQCRKKIGLLGVQCKCGFIYCNLHRLPQQHQCLFDFKQAGNQKLKKEIIKVYNGKITKI